MEKLELFVVGSNGQIEINFDSLELVTSRVFVKQIKRAINEGAVIKKVFEGEFSIYVYAITYGLVGIWRFQKEENTIEYSCVSKIDLEIFAKWFKEEKVQY